MESPLQKRNSRYLRAYVSIIALVLAFGLGIFVGQGREFIQKAGEFEKSAKEFLSTDGVRGQQRELAKSKNLDFGLFWQVWDEVKARHIKGRDISDEKLLYGAISGIVGATKDPYSSYFPPSDATQFIEDLNGSFDGIGAEIGMRDNVLTVIAPLPESPAEKAGIMAGDKIIQIDGQDASAFTLEEAVSKIRGVKGTAVKLGIIREGFNAVKDFEVVRDTIKIPNVVLKIENGIAYIQIAAFNDNTTQEVRSKIDEILSKKAKGIIVDLRNNPGGYLETSVELASEWLDDGETVVIERGALAGQDTIHKASGRNLLRNMPTVVLLNIGSASASEILAGALQDHGKAKIVGQKSFGKGSVQDFSLLGDGSALKLTIAEWLTPKERRINERGIEPDVAVKLEDAAKAALETPPKDLALEKARKTLEQIIADKKIAREKQGD